MSTTRISEPIARGARTGVQAVPAVVFTDMIDAFLYNMNDRQYGVLLAFMFISISAVQAAVENKFGYALFRKFTYTNPPIVSTPTTPLSVPGENVLPDAVAAEQPAVDPEAIINENGEGL